MFLFLESVELAVVSCIPDMFIDVTLPIPIDNLLPCKRMISDHTFFHMYFLSDAILTIILLSFIYKKQENFIFFVS